MNQLKLLVLLVTISSSAFSQINKGQWMVGGNASFSHSNVKQHNDFYHAENKATSVQVMPGAGYFFLDQFAAGLRAVISHSDVNVKQETVAGGPVSYYSLITSKITAFALSPFARYYFLPSSRKINVFADISYAYGSNKERSTVEQEYTSPGNPPAPTSSYTTIKNKSNSFSIAAGPAFFINPKVSVELTAGYSFTKYDGNTNQKGNTFLFGAGFQIHLTK